MLKMQYKVICFVLWKQRVCLRKKGMAFAASHCVCELRLREHMWLMQDTQVMQVLIWTAASTSTSAYHTFFLSSLFPHHDRSGYKTKRLSLWRTSWWRLLLHALGDWREWPGTETRESQHTTNAYKQAKSRNGSVCLELAGSCEPLS